MMYLDPDQIRDMVQDPLPWPRFPFIHEPESCLFFSGIGVILEPKLKLEFRAAAPSPLCFCLGAMALHDQMIQNILLIWWAIM